MLMRSSEGSVCVLPSERARGKPFQIDIIGQRHVAGVHLEDFHAPFLRRASDTDVAVKAAWPQKGRIENIRAIRGGEHDHEVGLREPIHLTQYLIERLLPL